MCILCVYKHVHVSVNMELLRPQTPDEYLYINKNEILQNAMQILLPVYQFDMMKTAKFSHVLTGALFVLKGKQISIKYFKLTIGITIITEF